MIVVISDLHLTAQPLDEYRWAVMYRLQDEVNANADVTEVWCLGDITDAKDKHPSSLVNRLVEWVLSFEVPVRILKGNHDYINGEMPFFKFLDSFEDIYYYTEPTVEDTPAGRALWLPHTRTAVDDWAAQSLDGVDIVLTHQSYDGAMAANGFKLESKLTPRYFSKRGFKGVVLSGDIHTPQTIGDVTYVGTQYPVVFGDTYSPRYLEVHGSGANIEVHPVAVDAPRKLVVNMTTLEDLPKLNAGDQVRVIYSLERCEIGRWDEICNDVRTCVEFVGAILRGIECRFTDVNHKQGTAHSYSKSAKSSSDIVRSFIASIGLGQEDESYALKFTNDKG